MTELHATAADRAMVLDRLSRALDRGLLGTEAYDARVAATAAASSVRQLREQLEDLPPEYRWPAPTAGPRAGGASKAALALGIAAVPLSFCLIGGVLGVVALVLGRRAERGDRAALIGRVLGIVGIALSGAAGFALVTMMGSR